MNEYKLQYHYPESSIDTAYIVERTEAAARKTLIKRFGKEIEIDDTELVSTDANATKEQEREALEKIKAMVEELGPQSYLKTAFTGVYEVAEMNIEEDAAYSFPGRISLLEEQLREMGSKCKVERWAQRYIPEPEPREREAFENLPSGMRDDRNTRRVYSLGLALAEECPGNDCRVYLNIFNMARELDEALDKVKPNSAPFLALRSALMERARELREMYLENHAVQQFKEGMQP